MKFLQVKVTSEGSTDNLTMHISFSLVRDKGNVIRHYENWFGRMVEIITYRDSQSPRN